MNEQEILKQFQQKNHENLVEIDRICQKHGIKYFLHGGTLLGAIRHKGVIPWDDDIDLLLLREDYDKLMSVIEDELGENFAISIPGKMKGYFDMIPKVRNLTCSIDDKSDVAKFYDNVLDYPTLDLFMLDKTPGKFVFTLQKLVLKMIYGFAMGHRYKVVLSKYHGVSKIFVSVFSKIGKLMKMSTIARWYDKVAQWGNKAGAKWGAVEEGQTYWSPTDQMKYFGKIFFKRDWVEPDAIRTEFDGMMAPIPAGYEEILNKFYGDYMQLPPEDQRVAAHLLDRYTFVD